MISLWFLGFPVARRALRFSALLVFLVATPAFAHEIGTTQANVTFSKNGTYQIDIRVDPETLIARLEFATGADLSEPAAERQIARLRELGAEYVDNVHILFDGARVQPQLQVIERASSTPGTVEAIMRMTGAIPKGSRTFRFQYSLLYSGYILRLAREGEKGVITQFINASEQSKPFEVQGRAPSRAEVARQYLLLGFTHIVPKGLDHILFVLGIFLLSKRLKPVLLQVSAFTVAHTITLGLTIYGLVSLSPKIVEPLIALSIVYVAVENLTTDRLKPWRVALVFAFGLLHGMGFAGVLEELGLPRSEFATALVTFNIGVELGQLSVIAAAFLLLTIWTRHRAWYRQRVVVPASLLIAAVGAFWFVERVVP